MSPTCTLKDIGTGDLIVASTLENWGFKVAVTTSLNILGIEAISPNEKLFVYVVSATYPDEPEMPSLNQINRLNKYALTIGAKVWIAKVQLTKDIELQGKISWTRVSP